jgi:hypothetical protein
LGCITVVLRHCRPRLSSALVFVPRIGALRDSSPLHVLAS